jgi:hypothetical protein
VCSRIQSFSQDNSHRGLSLILSTSICCLVWHVRTHAFRYQVRTGPSESVAMSQAVNWMSKFTANQRRESEGSINGGAERRLELELRRSPPDAIRSHVKLSDDPGPVRQIGWTSWRSGSKDRPGQLSRGYSPKLDTLLNGSIRRERGCAHRKRRPRGV